MKENTHAVTLLMQTVKRAPVAEKPRVVMHHTVSALPIVVKLQQKHSKTNAQRLLI